MRQARQERQGKARPGKAFWPSAGICLSLAPSNGCHSSRLSRQACRQTNGKAMTQVGGGTRAGGSLPGSDNLIIACQGGVVLLTALVTPE